MEVLFCLLTLVSLFVVIHVDGLYITSSTALFDDNEKMLDLALVMPFFALICFLKCWTSSPLFFNFPVSVYTHLLLMLWHIFLLEEHLWY